MDGARHEILSDTAFSAHEDGRVRIGDAADRRPDGAHGDAPLEDRDVADQIVLSGAPGDRRSVCCISSFSRHKPLLCEP